LERPERHRNLFAAKPANTFTTQEINALTAFIETEEGQSIMLKYGSYLAAVTPIVTAEFERALDEIKAELNEK
jgi:hypothetical protein